MTCGCQRGRAPPLGQHCFQLLCLLPTRDIHLQGDTDVGRSFTFNSISLVVGDYCSPGHFHSRHKSSSSGFKSHETEELIFCFIPATLFTVILKNKKTLCPVQVSLYFVTFWIEIINFGLGLDYCFFFSQFFGQMRNTQVSLLIQHLLLVIDEVHHAPVGFEWKIYCLD